MTIGGRHAQLVTSIFQHAARAFRPGFVGREERKGTEFQTRSRLVAQTWPDLVRIEYLGWTESARWRSFLLGEKNLLSPPNVEFQSQISELFHFLSIPKDEREKLLIWISKAEGIGDVAARNTCLITTIKMQN